MRLAPAAAATLAAVALLGCGEKEERVVDVSAGEARALVAAGVRGAGGDAVPRLVAFRADGPVLQIRTGPVRLGALAHFSAVRAQIVAFCPKPAILGCRPALQAAGELRRTGAFGDAVQALHELARQTYEQRALRRRPRPGHIEIVTANGELLGAARRDGSTVRLSFGGPAPPPAAAAAGPAGKVTVEAGPDALAAMRRSLGPKARGGIAGIRRLELTAGL